MTGNSQGCGEASALWEVHFLPCPVSKALPNPLHIVRTQLFRRRINATTDNNIKLKNPVRERKNLSLAWDFKISKPVT